MKFSSPHFSPLIIGGWGVIATLFQQATIVAAQTTLNGGEISFAANALPNSIEQKCYFTSADCNLRVGLRCRYDDPDTEERKNCIDLTDNDDPFIKMSKSSCDQNNGSIMVDAVITYRMCNDNDETFTPSKTSNKIMFRNDPVDPNYWDKELQKQECRLYQLQTKIDLCRKGRSMEIVMDGNLNKVGANYCRCYLFKKAIAQQIDGNDYKTKSPNPSPVSSGCNLKNAIITELASPENKVLGRYIEIYFGTDCEQETINQNLSIISMKYDDDDKESRTAVSLNGKKIPKGGFFVICTKNNGNNIYGDNTCDLVAPTVANITGVESIAIVKGDPFEAEPDDFIDTFGFLRKNVVGSNQDFTGGRALRKKYEYAEKPGGFFWSPKFWIVEPNLSHFNMDPRIWTMKEVTPKAKLIITEIFDPYGTESVPRFIELYAPKEKDRGKNADDLKLVIFRGDSVVPDWRFAVAINKVKDGGGYGDGFFVVCNDEAADLLPSVECDKKFDLWEPSQSGKGRYQVGIVNGNADAYKLVDIFGDIGAIDNAFVFKDSRAVRDLKVTDPTDTWSKSDWTIYETGSETSSGINGADPQRWEEVKFTEEPSLVISEPPTSAPSDRPSEYTLDCDLYFTELADPVGDENTAFIEIQTTCPNKRIRNVFIKTFKQLQNPKFELIIKVPDDGYIIICEDKVAFEKAYKKTCDIEKPNALPKGLYTIAVIFKDERLDIYGKMRKVLPEDSVYQNGRAYRDLRSEDGSEFFDPLLWYTVPGRRSVTVSPDDCDPRSRTQAPLELFFTEFADPVPDENVHVGMRFIELYSPNRRKYKIEEDLSIIKFAKNKNPYAFQTLKGLKINKNGFLVLTIGDLDDEIWAESLGSFSIVNGPFGTEDFSLAACANPKEEGMEKCPSIDEYGLGVNVDKHDFTHGRAVRRLDKEAPQRKFDPSDWVIEEEVDYYYTDPGAWYEVNMAGNEKTPPSPAPSWKGKGH